jgi:hypothetical protein
MTMVAVAYARPPPLLLPYFILRNGKTELHVSKKII